MKNQYFSIYLGVRSLSEIVQQILGPLSYQDLKSAELASPAWREAISKGNLWKFLLRKQVSIQYTITVIFFTLMVPFVARLLSIKIKSSPQWKKMLSVGPIGAAGFPRPPKS